MLTGVPPKIQHNFLKSAPGFEPQFALMAFALGLALTLGWLYVAFFTAPSPMRGVTRWAAGVALLWGCFAALLMPWADYQRSYRSVALQLRSKVPVDAGCIAGQNLGVTQRAALSYHAGLRTVPVWISRVPASAACCWCRAARRTSATVRTPPGPRSPTSAGPATSTSATGCTGWGRGDERPQHACADRVPGLGEARGARRGLARGAACGALRQRPAARRAVRGARARPAAGLFAPEDRRARAAAARAARRRARLRRLAARAVRRRGGQLDRVPARAAHGAARGRRGACAK